MTPPRSPQLRRVVASAPGKLILLGEHAAVYGCPAVVAAVSRRLQVRVATGGRAARRGVSVALPDLGFAGRAEWPSVLRRTADARVGWEAYRRDPGPESFAALRSDDPADGVHLALGETARAAGIEAPPPTMVEVGSELPVGSGFGSSAALAVTVAAGALASWGLAVDRGRVAGVALEVERRLHGSPSGVDHTTVLRGGLLWARGGRDRPLEVVPLPAPATALGGTVVFDSGRPAETTGEVVAAVGRRLAADRAAAESVLAEMEETVTDLRALLAAAHPDPHGWRALIRRYHRQLVGLGVVPVAVRRVVDRIEAAGGAAKVSGAGALTGDGGGIVVAVHPHGSEGLDGLTGDWRRLPLELGAPGLVVAGAPGSPGALVARSAE